MSNGRLEIETFGSGEVVEGVEVIDAVHKGTLEGGYWTPYYDLGKAKAGEIIVNPPFGLPLPVAYLYYEAGPGADIMREYYERLGMNVHLLGWSFSPMSPEIFFKDPVRNLADRKGKKVRVIGMQASVYEELGASVVQVDGGDLYTSLQTGAIDGAKYGSIALAASIGLHEVARYLVLPGWQDPCPVAFYVINKDEWNALPDDLKAIMEAAGKQAATHYSSAYGLEDAVWFKKLVDEGINVIKTPDEDLRAIRDIVYAIQDERALEDEFYAKALNTMRDFSAFAGKLAAAQSLPD
jgi:TRAP-type mannitol/chloroaromatic compound transport system substrate-binding protein